MLDISHLLLDSILHLNLNHDKTGTYYFYQYIYQMFRSNIQRWAVPMDYKSKSQPFRMVEINWLLLVNLKEVKKIVKHSKICPFWNCDVALSFPKSSSTTSFFGLFALCFAPLGFASTKEAYFCNKLNIVPYI